MKKDLPIEKIFTYSSPIGPLGVVLRDSKVCRLQFLSSRAVVKRSLPQKLLVTQWLDDYFKRKGITPFPWEEFDLSQRSDFEKRVWRQLGMIPFGEAVSYQRIAREIGIPKGPRAVGQANKRNPIPLLIPCHRVIKADGSMGGYACGLEIKRKLMKHEGLSIHERP